MEVDCLDLRAERCPMALLLAKRQCLTLRSQQTLSILSKDRASVADMVRYFSQPPYSIDVQPHNDEWVLLVTKRNLV